MRFPIAACILLAAACGPAAAPPAETRECTLQILSLNRLQGLGESIPCQPGEIAVLPAAGELRDRLAAAGDTALLFAIGDSINRSYKPVHGKAAELATITRSHIQLDALAAVGVDAYVPGHGDFATGFDELLRRCAERDIPVLLSNVAAPAHANIRPWIVLQAGTVKVGLLGVVAAKVADTEAVPEEGARTPLATDMVYPGVSLLPVNETVERLVGELRSTQGVDLVVLLSNLSQKSNTRLAAVTGLNVIIGTTDTSIDATGIVLDKSTAIMSASSAGREVGHTTLAIRNGNMSMSDLSPVHLVRQQVASVEERLAEYARHHGTDDPVVLARLVAQTDQQGFLNMVGLLAENKEFLRTAQSWTDSYIDHRPAQLQPVRPDHPALAVMAGVGPAIEAVLATPGLKPVVLPDARPLIPVPEDCRACHASQVSFWEGTSHSTSFESLKPGQLMHDVSCLPCHAAGFEDPAGWTDPRFDAPLGGVTCYVCHDSYAHHSSSVRQVLDPLFVHADTERMQCSDCHGERRSPGFDKDALIGSVSCPPMRADEPALLLARQAAVDAIRNRRERGNAEPRDEYLEGRALVGLGAFEQGFEILDRYAAEHPADSALRVEIARRYEQYGYSSGALELLRRYLEVHSGDPVVNHEYISLLLNAKDVAARNPELALSQLGFLLPKEAADSRKVALDFRVLKIDALFAAGRAAEGLALINELSREHSRDPRLESRINRYIQR